MTALESGVRVFGASSMGALRAAELAPFGMVGVGQVFAWVKDGSADDADVALLHADAEHAYRPLTVPQVSVRFAAGQARRGRALTAKEERALVAASRGVFYQERTWPRVLAQLSPQARRKWDRWAGRGLPDVKASDARECLLAAAKSLRAAPRAAARRLVPLASARVRARELRDGSPGVLEALWCRADAAGLRDAGLRRALLAGQARELGLRASPDEVARAEREWLSSLGVSKRDRAAFLRASGLDELSAQRLCEELALEQLLVRHAARLLNDGPGDDEALASEARLRGHFAALSNRKNR